LEKEGEGRRARVGDRRTWGKNHLCNPFHSSDGHVGEGGGPWEKESAKAKKGIVERKRDGISQRKSGQKLTFW